LLEGIGSAAVVAARRPELLDPFVEQLTRLAGATDPTTAAPLGEVFRRLLKCERAVATTSKAQTVMWGHGRVFQEAHIITQVRPPFFADIERGAETAVIVHELRVEFREGAVSGSICVVMDGRQLDDLRDVLDRARAKEASLRNRTDALTFLSLP